MIETLPPFAELFDLSSTLAAPLLERYDGRGSFFSLLEEFILETGPDLPRGWDEIAENVWVGSGTVIASSAKIRGPALIGRNVEIKHGAVILDCVLLDDEVRIGNETEISSALLFPEVRLYHRNLVRRAVLGRGVRFGAGAVQGSWRTGVKPPVSFEALVGDRCDVGDNSVLLPGTVLGAGSFVEPLAVVEGSLPHGSRVLSDGGVVPRA